MDSTRFLAVITWFLLPRRARPAHRPVAKARREGLTVPRRSTYIRMLRGLWPVRRRAWGIDLHFSLSHPAAPKFRDPSLPGDIPSASVIIACYNDADIVERNLAAFARQSRQDFEIVIADDGSAQDYGPMLERWTPRFAHPIQHVRHEDLGFRKTRIQNRAVLVSRSAYLIFIDADCLPHHDFVRNHLGYVEPGMALAGRRTEVARQDIPSAEQILKRGVGLGPARLVWLWLRGRVHMVEHGFVFPFAGEVYGRGILGSNFSLWKKDLEKINGFNAAFVGPGWEDTDIDFRLQLVGVRIKILRHKIVEYHVDHAPRVWSDALNQERLIASQQNRISRAEIGLAEIQEGDFEHKVYGRR